VHVQHTDERNFYALDRLWRDCPIVDVDLDGVSPSGVTPTADTPTGVTPSAVTPTGEST
jgi:hypothetical protein